MLEKVCPLLAQVFNFSKLKYLRPHTHTHTHIYAYCSGVMVIVVGNKQGVTSSNPNRGY